MNYLFCILLLIGTTNLCYTQKIIRSNINSLGNSTNYSISQSVGQSALSQNLFFEDCYYSSGFQQGAKTKRLNNQIQFEVYPNPTTDYFTIHSNSLEKFTFQIRDQTGKIILANNEENFKSTSVQLPNFAPGLYYLLVFSENNTQTFKLLISE